MMFTFSEAVTGFDDPGSFTVGGVAGDSLVGDLGTTEVVIDGYDEPSTGEAVLITSGANIAFTSGRTPAYPMTGTVT